MKITYNNLLGETKQLFDSQPEEVRKAIITMQEIVLDSDLQTVLDYLDSDEIKYVTYSHS